MAVLTLFAAVLSFLVVRVGREAERANREAERANREAQAAEQVSDFLVGLFEVSDPSESRGNTITAREILDKGVSKVSGKLQDQPLVRAKLQATIGIVYKNLGLLKAACPLLEALECRRPRRGEQAYARETALGAEHLDVAKALSNLGTVCKDTGRYEEAETYFNRSMAIKEKILEAGDPSLATGFYNLAALQRNQGMLQKAEGSYRRALTILEEALGPDEPEVSEMRDALELLPPETGA